MHLQVQPQGNASRREERRRHRRVLFSVAIQLHSLTPSGVCSTRGISLDISEGGVGALVQRRLLIGEAVELDLQLPKCSLSAVALVRHCSSNRSGFEFLGLTSEERRQINDVIKAGIAVAT